jgi:hypothetical protein
MSLISLAFRVTSVKFHYFTFLSFGSYFFLCVCVSLKLVGRMQSFPGKTSHLFVDLFKRSLTDKKRIIKVERERGREEETEILCLCELESEREKFVSKKKSVSFSKTFEQKSYI